MLISPEENDEFLLNNDFIWINSTDRIDLIYMTNANSKTVLTINKKILTTCLYLLLIIFLTIRKIL